MSDNPHPLYRQKACELCASGMPILKHSGMHYGTIGYVTGPWKCTAPTESAYIAELESQIEELERDKARLDEADRLMITNGHPTVGYSVKYPGSEHEWHREKTLREVIDAAMAAQEQKKCNCGSWAEEIGEHAMDCPEYPFAAHDAGKEQK